MLASLLVSVLLVGIKLTAAIEIVQSITRKKELKANLLLLQRSLEGEDKKSWIEDVTHDTAQRQDRILELGTASGPSYTTTEYGFLQNGEAMLALFESSRTCKCVSMSYVSSLTCCLSTDMLMLLSLHVSLP